MLRRATRHPTAYSKVSVKSQTVLPCVVRVRLNIRTGDTLRYCKEGVLLDNASSRGRSVRCLLRVVGRGQREKAYADL